MRARWLAVTFYTEGTGYEREVLRLIRSANEHGIALLVERRPNLGDWRQNLNHKSMVILEAMAANPGKDIVWLDADAVVRRKPVLFDQLSERHEHDIAFHRFVQSRLDPGKELLSGTLWLANSEKGSRLVADWHVEAVGNPRVRHQRALDIVLRRMAGEYRVFLLPLSYTAIYDHPAVRKHGAPVIEHFQASRRFRRRLQGTTEAARA